MYSSLNIGVYYAFKEKRADRIPLLSAILGLLSSIGWSLYSVAVQYDEDKQDIEEETESNIITMLSNTISIIVLIIPIVSYIYLAKKYPNNTISNNLTEENPEKNKIKLENKDEEEDGEDN